MFRNLILISTILATRLATAYPGQPAQASVRVSAAGVSFEIPATWTKLPGTLDAFGPLSSMQVTANGIQYSRGATVGRAAILPFASLLTASRGFGAEFAISQRMRLSQAWSLVPGSNGKWAHAQFSGSSNEGGVEVVDMVTFIHHSSLFWLAFTRPLAAVDAMAPVFATILRSLEFGALPAQQWQSNPLVGVWHQVTSDYATYTENTVEIRADGTYTQTKKLRITAYSGSPTGGGTHDGRWRANGYQVQLSGDGNFPPSTVNLRSFTKIR